MYTEQKKNKNKSYSTIKELQCSPLTVNQQQGILPPQAIESSLLKYFRRMFTTGSKSSTDEFTIVIDEKFKHLNDIIFLHSTIRFEWDDIAPDMLYIYFQGFPVTAARTGTNYPYHFAVPTRNAVQIGDCLTVQYKFPENYSLYIGTQIHLKQFVAQVFYEDRDDHGIFKLYKNVQYLDVEVLFK